MFTTDKDEAYVRYLHAEHQRLHHRVRQIQSSLARWSRQNDTLKSLLFGLRRELRTHFRDEEEGGCLEEAVSRLPSLSETVQQLEREHPDLLRQLNDILAHVSELPPDRLKARFDAFTEQWRAHEAMERDVMQRGFNVHLE